jgi:DnaJ-class molecular chaperone
MKGWKRIPCGCCNGVRWGGEYPEECQSCGGSGVIWEHKKSGALALWPGGPFCGQAERGGG